MLPTAMANTTFRRTVPLRRCRMLAGILVRKLKSASDPTAMMAGTRRPKMSVGSSKTPPPSPVKPISIPTPKPIRIFASTSSMGLVLSSRFSVLTMPVLVSRRDLLLLRTENRELRTLFLAISVNSDEAFAFQVQNDGLRRFFGIQFAVSIITSAFVGTS